MSLRLVVVIYLVHHIIALQKSDLDSSQVLATNPLEQQRLQQSSIANLIPFAGHTSNNITSLTSVEPLTIGGSEPFCTNTPRKLNFCSNSLGWAPTMRLPNLLGHKSINEFTDNLNSPSLSALLNEVSSLECKGSEHLKLFLCATLSPICLDVVVPPCRSVCMAAKATCRSAMQRRNLDWPRSLDCRRFPRSQENCIGKIPNLHFNEIVDINSTAVSTTTTRPNTSTYHRTNEYSSHRGSSQKRRRKEKKDKKLLVSNSSNVQPLIDQEIQVTTLAPNLNSSDLSSTTDTSSNARISSNKTTSSNDTSKNLRSSSMNHSALNSEVTTQRFQAGNASYGDEVMNLSHTSTTQSPTSISLAKQTQNMTTPIPNLDNVQTTTSPNAIAATLMDQQQHQASHQTVVELSRASDYSSMPISVTEDVLQLVCSTSPEWLIKAKLTDNQLLTAVKRRKLKIRSYRQIFGPPMNGSLALSGPIANNNHPLQPVNSRLASSSIRANTSLYLTLTNSTIFVTAMGPTLYTQPLTDALSRASDSQADNDSKSQPTGRAYLISGSNSNLTTNSKPVSVFIVWPGPRSMSDSDIGAGIEIIKAYKEFKLRGAEVCRTTPVPSDSRSNKHSSHVTGRLRKNRNKTTP